MGREVGELQKGEVEFYEKFHAGLYSICLRPFSSELR